MKKPKNKHGKQFSKLIPKIKEIIIKYTPQEETIFTFLFSPGLSNVLDGTVPKSYLDEFYSINVLQKKYKKINVRKVYFCNRYIYRKNIPIKSFIQVKKDSSISV